MTYVLRYQNPVSESLLSPIYSFPEQQTLTFKHVQREKPYQDWTR